MAQDMLVSKLFGGISGGLGLDRQQVLHHLVAGDPNVPAVLIALKSVIVVFWVQLNQNVSVMDVCGVHRLSKENHGVSIKQGAVQQLNLHLVVHLAMLLIVPNVIVVMLEPINSRVKRMDAVGNQLIPMLVYHGVTFPHKNSLSNNKISN